MKIASIVVPILLLASEFAFTQDTARPAKKIYKASLLHYDLNRTNGYILGITDSSVLVSHWPVRLGTNAKQEEDYKEIKYKTISEITIKRNHGAGRGAWKGAIIGLAVGALAGFIEGADPEEYWFRLSALDKAIMYGTTGAAAGTGIGALVGGLARLKFPINGKKERFDDMRLNVLSKAYGTNTASTR